METITEIRPYEQGEDEGDYYLSLEAGFQIVTTEQTITLAIDDVQDCCEKWGYFLTEDDTEKFIGAELRGVQITDTNRSSRTFAPFTQKEGDIALDEGDVMFVDIQTDRGVLQFVAYNCHNGYYGHKARVSSGQLTASVLL